LLATLQTSDQARELVVKLRSLTPSTGEDFAQLGMLYCYSFRVQFDAGNLLGRAFFLGQNFSKALEFVTIAIQHNPKNPLLHHFKFETVSMKAYSG